MPEQVGDQVTGRESTPDAPLGPDLTPYQRRAMAALMATGHYEETPDAFDWLWSEAIDVAACMAEPDPADSMYRTLTDTAFHDVTQPTEVACLRDDVARIVEALR